MNAIVANTDIQIRSSPAPQAMHTEQQASRPPAETQFPTPSDPDPTPQAVERAAEGVNAFLKASGTTAQFAFQPDAKRMVVEVKDNTTGEVIRTIPSKELLDLSERIGEMVGVLIDEKG